MADCHDCNQPVLAAHVCDSDGNEWHLRCLDATELDELNPADIRR